MVRKGSNTIRDRWNTVRLVQSLFMLANPRSVLASRISGDLKQSLTVKWQSSTTIEVTGRSPIITKLALAQLINLARQMSGLGGLELPQNSSLEPEKQWKEAIQSTFDRLMELGVFQDRSSKTEKFNGFRTFVLEFPVESAAHDYKLTWLRQVLELTGTAPSPQVTRHNIPEIDFFVGRTEELNKIHQIVQPGKITAITGMRGVGKSTLAKQYAWEHLAEYTGGICWIDTQADISHAVLSFQGLPFQASAGSAIAQLNECLKNWQFSGNILLIIDDFNDHQIVLRYLGQALKMPQVNILLTSWQMSGATMNEIKLDCLPQSDAAKLLDYYIGDRLTDTASERQIYCQQICEQVGYSPFAIEKLGYYLGCDRDLSLPVLLKQLRQNALAYPALAEVPPALQLVWERLSSQAQILGCLMSLFAQTPIPWQLLERFVELLELSEQVTAARPELLRYHLIERLGKDLYSLHGLMRQFLQIKLIDTNWNYPEINQSRRIFAQFIVKLAVKIPQDLNDITLPFWREAIYHVTEGFQASLLRATLTSSEVRVILSGLERYYKSRGNYDLALEWCERRQQLIIENNERQSYSHFTCLNDKAILHLWQQQYSAAQAALAEAKSLLCLLNPTESISLEELIISINWGAFYYNLGKYEQDAKKYQEAKICYNKALKIAKNKPEWDLYQINILNNLGVLHHESGSFQNLDRAKKYYSQALKLADEIKLPQNHPDRGRCLQSLAKLHQSEGDYLQALIILAQCLPSDHPELARSKYNLAYFYSMQGRYLESEKLLDLALPILDSKLGRTHPWTLEAQSLSELNQSN
jgi:tetratricopeptide (TPR) repeat protein